jgi:uncharacterized protein YdaU (DUF1376 family)
MKLFVGDYLADTGHLRTIEHGAYLLLIMHYWRTGPLPDDARKLASVARMSPREWAMHGAAVCAMFTATDGVLRHKRVDAEMAAALEVSTKRANAAHARHNGKGLKNNETTHANALHVYSKCTPCAVCLQALCICPATESHSQSQKEKEGKKEKATLRASRLPIDWTPSVADRAFARDLGLDPDKVAANFRDYWHGVPGAKGTKADWPATWRNKCRSDAERLRPAKAGGLFAGRPGNRDWMAERMRGPPVDREPEHAGPTIDAPHWETT